MSKGLSIEASDFPLVHEYYTPTVVAEAVADLVCPRLPELAGYDGIVRAFEPSVGIGRFVRALGPPHVDNLSTPSADISTNPAAKGLCHATYRHLRR
jgi:hypothetical protein